MNSPLEVLALDQERGESNLTRLMHLSWSAQLRVVR